MVSRGEREMNHCDGSWDMRRRGEEEEGRVTHQGSFGHSYLVPSISDYHVAELTWENGHLAMHGLESVRPVKLKSKPLWTRTGSDMLESVVQQAAQVAQANEPRVSPNEPMSWLPHCAPKKAIEPQAAHKGGLVQTIDRIPVNMSSVVASTSGICGNSEGSLRDREKSTPGFVAEGASEGACTTVDDNGSGSFGRDIETTWMTWASLESPSSTGKADCSSKCKRRSQAEKTDKASMLDEVIEYLKQLQAQVQMINLRSMPHMMMPMAMPLTQAMFGHHGGMAMPSLGMAMSVMDACASGAHPTPLIHPATASFMPPALLATHAMPACVSPEPSSSVPKVMQDPYSAFLAQSMNMDLYNKMAAFYQQMQQPTHVKHPAHVNTKPE
ncbi:transcription factor UNE10 isoform X2 [Amborella trichopoda]|uniref:transcription factor UNE10 isoform X2 n=1 Tax=Amborella trichopoda TaxID=13333 RepID=UPI0009BE9C3C|nr:transcription factor UNE10 isoform X2 [Amborella trichopoda]|eukprot:XP_020519130.1 transcription factor UNE10 isoform X2 [Amborella trichopoda]